MRKYLFGFNQDRACELGLNTDCLAILRWFIDFYASPAASKITVDNRAYMLVVQSKLSEDLPILGVSERTQRRLMETIIKSGVLDRHLAVTGVGTRAYYAPGKEYDSLLGHDTKAEVDDGGTRQRMPTHAEREQQGVIMYCQNAGIHLTARHFEEVAEFLAKGATHEVMCYAVDVTIENGAKGWAYARAIIQRWLAAGVTTVDAARVEQANFKRKKEEPSLGRMDFDF